MGFIDDFKDVQLANFLQGGYVKGLVYVPRLPVNLEELKDRFTTALQTATQDMLQYAWEEMEYWIDVCHVPEHVWNRLWNPHESDFVIHIWRNNSYVVQHQACVVSLTLTI